MKKFKIIIINEFQSSLNRYMYAKLERLNFNIRTKNKKFELSIMPQ